MVTSGMGQKARDMCRPPCMAEFAFLLRVTSGMGQKALDTCRPPRIAEFRDLCAERSLMPNSRETGPPLSFSWSPGGGANGYVQSLPSRTLRSEMATRANK